MADRGEQAVDRGLGLPRIAPELGCLGKRLDRGGIRSEWIDLSAIQERQDSVERWEAAVYAFGQLGIDVHERRVGFPSGKRLALEPENDARLVRGIRDVPVAGEHGPPADAKIPPRTAPPLLTLPGR